MQRRDYLKTVGGIGSATALGIGAAFFASTGASATSNVDLGSVSLRSDDGTIEHVSIYGDGRFEWKGLDTRATKGRIKVFVSVLDSNGNLLVDEQRIQNTGRFELSNDSWGGHDEEISGPGTRGYIESGVGLDANGNHDPSIDWAIIQASDYDDPYGLPESPVDASHLYVDSDGATETFTVEYTTQYEVLDAGSSTLQQASATSTLTVDVENIASQSSTSSGPEGDGASGGASNDGTL